MKFDIIGDIHGHFHTLERLLGRLGYTAEDGVWRHKERRVLFLGDYIDRGPMPRETLAVVRSMVEGGYAHAILGNHELNAIAYHTLDGHGKPLRPHSLENTKQHEATLKAFEGHSDEWADWIHWMKGLPLFFEGPGFQAVHACWCEASLARVRNRSLHDADFLFEATQRGNENFKAVEMLLKGPELDIGQFGLKFHAPKDRPREELRVRWWGYDADTYSLSEISMPPGAALEFEPVDPAHLAGIPNRGAGGGPVFFGHYCMPNDRPPAPLADDICCLDYGAGKGGALVAYRWDGEQVLAPSKFVVQPECTGGD